MKYWSNGREDIDWKRLRLPLRQKRELSKQTSLRYSCGEQIRTFVSPSRERRQEHVHDNTSKFELRSLLEHIHTRSWKGSGVHNVAEEYKIKVERMMRRQHLSSPSH